MGLFLLKGILVIEFIAQTKQNPASGYILIALIFAAMYFVMIRPQQKRRKEYMEVLRTLEVGDEIETVAGIFGTIRKLDDEHVFVEVAEGTTLKMSRGAIRRKIVAQQDSDAS